MSDVPIAQAAESTLAKPTVTKVVRLEGRTLMFIELEPGSAVDEGEYTLQEIRAIAPTIADLPTGALKKEPEPPTCIQTIITCGTQGVSCGTKDKSGG